MANGLVNCGKMASLGRMQERKREGAGGGVRGAAAPGMAAVAALLAGCAGTPEEVEAPSPVEPPAVWQSGEEDRAGEVGSWLADFGDAHLENLVALALGNNFNLQAALGRLEQANALARIEGADRLPNLSLGGSAARRSTRLDGDPGPRVRTDRFEVNALASWELDLWGRLKAQALAGEADALAAAGDFFAVRQSIAAQVAGAYFDTVERQEQAALAEETLRTFEESLRTVEERFQRGISPALDVQLARANVANARASLLQQQQLREVAQRRLETLVGRYPAGVARTPEQLPELPSPIPAGLPSELLERRPDLLAAQSRLVAADARLKQSRRALLPSLTLTASYGQASDELENLLEKNFDVWSLVGNLTAPLFQGGRLRAAVDRSEAALRTAVAEYGNVLLTAFREVETALVSEEILRERLRAVREAAEESAAAQELAEERYDRGLVDIITVLESQRRAFNARISAISVQNQLLQNRLSLYLSLGGEIR